MSLTPFKAFKFCFAIYVANLWLPLISYQDYILKTITQASSHPNHIWVWLLNNNLYLPLLITLSVCGFLLLWEKTTRYAAAFLLLNWFFLYQTMPMTYFPPHAMFVGWILLWFIFYPQDSITPEQRNGWWLVTTVAYGISGAFKFKADVWLQGDAMHLLMDSLMIKDHSRFLFNYPLITSFLTYSGLFLEMFGLLIICLPKGKTIIWYGYLFMHLWIITCFNIPEVGLFFLILNLALWDDSISLKRLWPYAK